MSPDFVLFPVPDDLASAGFLPSLVEHPSKGRFYRLSLPVQSIGDIPVETPWCRSLEQVYTAARSLLPEQLQQGSLFDT